MKAKALTQTQKREAIEKTGKVYLPHWVVDDNSITIKPQDVVSALSPIQTQEYYIVFKSLGIALPAVTFHDLAEVMGDHDVTVINNPKMMTVSITYKSTPDSRSRCEIKGIDALEFEPDAEGNEYKGVLCPVYAMDRAIETVSTTDTWIKKAVSKDQLRPEMMRAYGQFAADGFRIHYDPTLPLVPPEQEFYSEKLPAKVAELLTTAKAATNTARVPLKEFKKYLALAKKMCKRDVYISLNGTMILDSRAEELGSIKNEISEEYSHDGEDVLIRMCPAYLVDAVSGMKGKSIEIKVSAPTEIGGRTFHITDGNRQALIMSMLIEE